MFLIIFIMMGFGFMLNYFGDNVISERMENQHPLVKVVRAKTRDFSKDGTQSVIKFQAEHEHDELFLHQRGFIREILVKPFDSVEPGQVIAIAEDPLKNQKLAEADSRILSAEAELVRAESEYNRQQRMLARDATSVSMVELAERSLKMAQAGLSTAEAGKQQLEYELSQLNITSRHKGKVLLVYRREGDMVTMGAPIISVADYRELFFEYKYPDIYCKTLKPGTEVKLMIPVSQLSDIVSSDIVGNRFEKKAFDCQIVSVNPPLQTASSVRTVRSKVFNPEGSLLPRSYTDITVQLETEKQALAVPDDAVIGRGEKYYVYLLDQSDNTVHLQEVAIKFSAYGEKDGILYCAVEKGIKEGDLVVSDVEADVKEGTVISPLIEGEKEHVQ